MAPSGATSDLLLPGVQPPLTHFGVTLLRHVVVTGLRYTLYHLGLPMPDKVPVRIDQLRLYLDTAALAKLLGTTPEGRAICQALAEPAGTASDDETVPAGAAFFHRQRLRWSRRRSLPRAAAAPDSSVTSLEYQFRQQLAGYSPAFNDALLDEVVTVLHRRQRRRRGARLAPCLGREAAAWTRGRRARLDRLGPPDPYIASWADAPRALKPAGEPRSFRQEAGRGRFREVYRQALDRFRPTLVALGEAALANSVVDHRDDLFFLPFELLDDLTVETQPAWLSPAVLRNRGEYFGLRQGADEVTLAAWNAAPVELLA